jgi:hypothetical protein
LFGSGVTRRDSRVDRANIDPQLECVRGGDDIGSFGFEFVLDGPAFLFAQASVVWVGFDVAGRGMFASRVNNLFGRDLRPLPGRTEL